MRKGLALLALSLLVPSVGAEEGVLTLAEALRLAEEGPAVKAAEAGREAAGFRVAEARSFRLPQVELEAQARSLAKDPGFLVPRGSFGNPVTLALVTGERDVQSGKIGASYLLWDWGRTGSAVAAAEKAEQAAEAQVKATRRAVLRATVQAFAQAQRAQEELAAAEEAVATAQETLRVVSAAVQQELLPDSDRLAAEFFLARRQAEVAAARGQLTAALAVLAELTGVPARGVMRASVPEPPAVGEDAAEKREELQAAKAQGEAAAALAQAFRREPLPVVVLALGAENVRDHFLLHQTNSYGVVGVRANLFDGGRARALARQQEALARSSSFQQELLRRQVQREVTAAQAMVEAVRQQLAAAQKAEQAAQEELRLETKRHEQGLATTRDLLAAQEHLAQAKAAVAAAQAGLLQAVGELAAAAGEDLVRFFGGRP